MTAANIERESFRHRGSVRILRQPLFQAAIKSHVALAASVAMGATLGCVAGFHGQDASADAGLTALLRGMALIKGIAVLAGTGVAWWRFSKPVRSIDAAVYLVSLAAATAATVAIGWMAYIPVAAAVFHAALFAFLIAAWRDDLVISPSLHRESAVNVAASSVQGRTRTDA